MHFTQAKTILSAKNGINLYRGCSHGCIYCDSRSACYQTGHPFEDVAVKENGLALLEQALCRKKRPCMIGFGSMSDPYMHCEKELGYTRRCLELVVNFGFGVTLREGNREYFYAQLDRRFGDAYVCPSPREDKLRAILGEQRKPEEIFAYLNDFPEKYEQIRLV